MKPLNIPTVVFLLVWALPLWTNISAATQQDNIRLGISSQEAYVGVPVTLSISIQNADVDDPPRIPEVDGLDIRSAGVPSRSSTVSIINGRRSESKSVTYRYQITPRREGTFEIPAFSIASANGKSRTEPIRIVSTKSETGDLLFAEVTGQKEQLYVGQPIELTLRIWVKPFEDRKLGVKLSNADMFRLMAEQSEWGAFQGTLEKLGEDRRAVRSRSVLREDNLGQERSYYLYELDATFYPKRAGKLDVEDVQIVVNYPTRLGKSRDPFESMLGSSIFGGGSPFNDDFFRDRFSGFGNRLTVADSRPIVATPEVAPIEVVPIPTEGRPADYRGSVGKYQMVTQASPVHVKAGDPIDLKIGIRGTGPMELVQAPPLAKVSSLTTDFKVSDEPLAGVVQGDIKVFTTTIRPRRDGITQIPAIPFSFFDSEEEKFVTVYSKPIAIQVDKAEKLALDSIVGSRSKRGPDSEKRIGEDGPNLENFMDRSVLATQSSGPDIGIWLLLLAVPPALLGMYWWFRKLAGQSSGQTGGRRLTLARIRRADDPRQVSRSLLSLIANRLGRPTSSLTRPEAVTALSGLVDSVTIEELDRLLVGCENAAFAGNVGLAVGDLKSEARVLAGKLGRIRMPRQETRIASIERRWQLIATSLFGICLVGTTFWSVFIAFNIQSPRLLAGLADAPQVQLDPSQKATLFAEANTAYQRASESKTIDAAEARQGFSESARKYQTLVDSGVSNYKLFFNLGNAYLQSDSLGRAIANYQRSTNLFPLGTTPRRNLEFAQQLAGTNLEAETTSTMWLVGHFQAWVVNLPSSIWLGLLLTGWAGICLSCLVMLARPGFRARYFTVPATILLLSVAFGLTWRAQTDSPNPKAVFVADEVPVYQGSSEAFPLLSTLKVSEGDSVEVLQRRGDWVQIRGANGQLGWAKAGSLEQV